MSMKNSNYTIGNRTRDVPACSAVPQPNALPRAPERTVELTYISGGFTERHFFSCWKYNPNPTTHSIPSDWLSCCTQNIFALLTPLKASGSFKY
jgi:hypothetical protein